MQKLRFYFKEAVQQSASDVHLVGGAKPMLRIEGELVDLQEAHLEADTLKDAIYQLLSKDQVKKFEEDKELDFGFNFENERFRVNLHQQQDTIAMAARLIPRDIPTPEMLKFEPTLLDFTKLLDGLVLVTGPTGCGKSTVIASMIEEINKTRRAHIVSIEDPIEFIFKNNKSLIEQREVGADTRSFANALKYVLRQDPNVIFVGEMRDPETIATVVTAAETGHLVFSTLHTSSAAEAVERIVDVFEGSKQRQILIQLSTVLRGVITQQLIPAKDGGRVPAREILINTPAVANLIRESSIGQIKSVIQTSAKDGMITLESSIQSLIHEGWVDPIVGGNRSGRRKIW